MVARKSGVQLKHRAGLKPLQYAQGFESQGRPHRLHGSPAGDSSRSRNGKLSISGGCVMNLDGLGTSRLSLKLRMMSDDDLWWVLLHHREECGREFWREVENRKAAGILSDASPFWRIGASGQSPQANASGVASNVIQLTREEWETRRGRKR